MHQDFALFATITMALLTAFGGGYIARKLGLPSLVGYLLAGMVIGPFTPGFVGDTHAISQLAEMGVIFMMFGVGLHFSLKDLWDVRRIAIPGAVLQMLLATLLGFALTQLWGWSVSASLVLGLSISIASTVVLLRGLEDHGLLNTVHGKVAVGWLVLEDLATIAILVLLPVLVASSDNALLNIGTALLKTCLFVAIMLFVGARLMPWLLKRIAHTRSRELFILAVVALALGTAFAAAELFGVSLALGAFLAGVVIGESDISHQVGAEVTPFRDIFSVLFFVSVGMLVNPTLVLANVGQILLLTLLVVVGKFLLTVLMIFVLPAPGRTLIVVAAGLSQIGEFSFIVGQTGVALGILTQDQYGLILAAALLSIVINPLMFRAIPQFERFIQRVPALRQRMERAAPEPVPAHQHMTDHVVIVGYGRVGQHIGHVLQQLKLPFLVVERDAENAENIHKDGVQTLLGDAANSEVLTHAALQDARVLVVTVPDEVAAELIVTAAHDVAPKLPIIARAGTVSGITRLSEAGARHIIHPELEGGLELVRHMLLTLEYPTAQIQRYVDKVRHDAYEVTLTGNEQHPDLDQLLTAVRGVEISWYPILPNSPVVGKNLIEANIRANVGASVIALIRGEQVIPNPGADIKLLEGDMVGIIGNSQQLVAAEHFFSQSVPAD
jgi:monovalent cation:H+ antiporter-2, CPA2 family